MGLGEPCRVIEQSERRSENYLSLNYIVPALSILLELRIETIQKMDEQNLPVGRVMSLEILDQHLVNTIGRGRVAARVSHRAPTPVQILPHHHRNFPQAWIRPGGAGRYHAVVEQLVVQGVGPAGRSVLVNRHRRVVREVRVPQHFKHVVPSNLLRFQIDIFFNLGESIGFLTAIIILYERVKILPTRMGPSFLSRLPASRLHKPRGFHVVPQPLAPTFAERTARRNCACFQGEGRGFLSRSVDHSIFEKGDTRSQAGNPRNSIDRSTSFFSKSWKNNFGERIRNQSYLFFACLFIYLFVRLFVCLLGNRFSIRFPAF